MKKFELIPIGQVHKDGETFLEIYPEFAEALEGLNEGDWIKLILWFHKSDTPEKRKTLKVHPSGDPKNPLRGVFATRSPVRPNPIAIYTVKIVKIQGTRIFITEIDAFDGTPIVDIKPFVKELDCPKGI
ncbi:tRNA (N6-threonylcarbamoyladenosine(37)-N6)-methyltransferase TrmO [Thermococcus alcaliphilus]|uniref:tRNA (N6-threonylcarbamoyladenosine(37)-N6)-methyltransferase TrmO n=1 Tax=Thermococcus alcaliphilus TaxID=139207 RepID=UPI0020902545|nr:tRNA (N6-threonylcarbamoyladenosine(37)-N6)-methyltransferase TrmO [Thermococcus alcaliphilus]MCO6041291.1 tRNA (N6-threonylcarbamoyladenosine(37)-N6)-methyltransferase TrmO [Thermococcus alcaliphilus]